MMKCIKFRLKYQMCLLKEWSTTVLLGMYPPSSATLGNFQNFHDFLMGEHPTVGRSLGTGFGKNVDGWTLEAHHFHSKPISYWPYGVSEKPTIEQ